MSTHNSPIGNGRRSSQRGSGSHETLPSIHAGQGSQPILMPRRRLSKTQPVTSQHTAAVHKSRTRVRALAVKSDGTKYGQLVPLQPHAPIEVATSSEVLHCITGLRTALRKRHAQHVSSTVTITDPSACLSGEELSAAKDMFAEIGRRGMSSEELCTLTGVKEEQGAVPIAQQVTPAPLPAKPAHTAPMAPLKPPTVAPTLPTAPPGRSDGFIRRTKVRGLLAPEKLLLSEDDISPASGDYAATMANVESAVDSREEAIKRADRYADRVRQLIVAWEKLCFGDYDTLADKVMARMLEKTPSLEETPFTCTTHEEALALMGMVGRAVVAFTSPEDTVEVTLEMGAKHHMYGVTEAHYTALRDAFMEELPHWLPAAMYSETLHLWETMWRMIISLLVVGASSERGAFYAHRKHEKWVAIVQKTLTEVVKREMGGPQDERKHPFIVYMYDRGVEIDPSMKRYFLLREVRNADRSMEAVIRIVTNLHDMPAVDAFLEELGIRHIEYDMTEKTLKTYRKPFLDTCAQYIGDDPEYWNPDSIKAVGSLWDYVVQKWAIGFNVNKKSMSNANAPESNGQFCLIFTDIEASTKLWEKNRPVMRQAVKNHHRIIRALIADFDGYEVKTIGDSFMIACKDALIALKIAVGIQLEFMRTPTTQDFEMIEYPQGMGDASCWRSDAVRVRIGIHYCTHANAVYDPVQRRYDYYGPDVNLAARTEAAACGGQILMTEEAYNCLKNIEKFTTEPRHRLLAGISTTVEKGSDEYMKPLSEYVTFPDLGYRDMKGIADPVHLYGAVPVALAGRVFPTGAEQSVYVSTTSNNTIRFVGLGSSNTVDDDELGDVEDVEILKPLGADEMTGTDDDLPATV